MNKYHYPDPGILQKFLYSLPTKVNLTKIVALKRHFLCNEFGKNGHCFYFLGSLGKNKVILF